MIISEDDYKKLDNVPVTVPQYPGAFTATNTAQTGKYQKDLMEFYTHQKVEKASVEFLQKSFDETGILHDMKENDGVINNTLLKIIEISTKMKVWWNNLLSKKLRKLTKNLPDVYESW